MSTKDIKTNAQLLAQGFADHMVAWAKELNASENSLKLLHRAAVLTSTALSEGHACIFLQEIQRSPAEPDEAEMRGLLISSCVVGTTTATGAMPLILDDDGRLYLHRYFDYEHRLALRLMSAARQTAIVDERMKARLDALFASNNAQLGDRPDWQKIAAALAMQKRLTIISGGPGTGKTTTVVNLLACLLEENPACRVALAAPTGKAAARMLEAIRSRASHLPAELQARMPKDSFTVHRLLGVTRSEGKFQHHAENLLAVDALVVDEASMLDIALATKLFEAVPETARIILLGDKDQLSAVEAGAVFAELSADPTLSPDCVVSLSAVTGIPAERIRPDIPSQPTPLHDSVVWFSESYRFRNDSGIGKLAAEINAGDAENAIAWLRSNTDPLITWIEDGEKTADPQSMQRIFDSYAEYLNAIRTNPQNMEAAFEAFGRSRILCAVREGARGADAINKQISRYFRNALDDRLDLDERSEWYPGRPVMVLRNDYLLKLFNGDIGIALPNALGNLGVFFPDSETGFRMVPIVRLPEHESAFAITVHKSQGSEFDKVILMLPAEPNRVVSRELLYTAITRSRAKVTIISNAQVFEHAVQSPTRRRSGLIARMKECGAPLQLCHRS
jgi:exodeoxyribonuclease V alpha subunit